MRLGLKLPTEGLGEDRGLLMRRAITIESLGYDGLWIADHVVMPAAIESRYPYSADGRVTWQPSAGVFEALVLASMAAAVTSTVQIGTAVLVAPLRNPVLLAKQLASLQLLSGGRFSLGIGVGWLREEFEALGVPFADRGRRTDEWIDLLRDCYGGDPSAFSGRHYDFPPEMTLRPVPTAALPVLVGGTSPAALARAAARADGWIALEALETVSVEALRARLAELRGRLEEVERDPSTFRVVLRLTGSATGTTTVVRLMQALWEIGVDELILDGDLRGSTSLADQYGGLEQARASGGHSHDRAR